MKTEDFYHLNRWSIQKIRAKIDSIENPRSKLILARKFLRLIKKSKPKGSEKLSSNSIITIRKINQYIDLIASEEKNLKADKSKDERLEWTGTDEQLVDLFLYLRLNSSETMDKQPFLNESLFKISTVVYETFKVKMNANSFYKLFKEKAKVKIEPELKK